MEFQFEVANRFEKKHFVEAYRFILRWRLTLIGLCLFACVACVFGYVYNSSELTLVYSGLLLIYAVFLYCRPWTAASATMKRQCGDADLAVTRFGDMIYDENPHITVKMAYQDVNLIRILPHIILIKDSRSYIFIDRNGFTKGSYEEFLSFIREKCPHIQIPNE